MSERALELPEPIPPLALAVFIACVAGGGILTNLSVVAAVIHKPITNGIYCIILQLAITDICLGATVSLELWSSNERRWCFGDSGCVVYKGLQVLTTTASSYFVATIAMHTLATMKLEEKAELRRRKRRNEDDEESPSSRHSLVACSNSSTPPRTMNLEYRLIESKVSVIQPVIFIWILSISLSIPDFILATPLHLDNVVYCTVIDTGKKLHLYSIFALCNLFLQSFLMLIVGLLVIVKMRCKKKTLEIENNHFIGSLKLSISLIIVHAVLCVPRLFLTAYEIYSKALKQDMSFSEITKENNYLPILRVSLSSVYLASVLIHPLLSIFLLPCLQKKLCFKSKIKETNKVCL